MHLPPGMINHQVMCDAIQPCLQMPLGAAPLGQLRQHPRKDLGCQIFRRRPVSHMLVDVAIQERIVGLKDLVEGRLIQLARPAEQRLFFGQNPLLWLSRHQASHRDTLTRYDARGARQIRACPRDKGFASTK